MKFITVSALAAAGFGGVGQARSNYFHTSGTPIGCGTQTCCQPKCTLFWKDSKGCDGIAESAGNCLETFDGKSETDDTGVDICDGAGLFTCKTGKGRVVYVINTAGEVSAAHVPKPDVCTLEGQCAECDNQFFCGPPVYIGKVGDDGHNCKRLNAKLEAADNKPKRCNE